MFDRMGEGEDDEWSNRFILRPIFYLEDQWQTIDSTIKM